MALTNPKNWHRTNFWRGHQSLFKTPRAASFTRAAKCIKFFSSWDQVSPPEPAMADWERETWCSGFQNTSKHHSFKRVLLIRNFGDEMMKPDIVLKINTETTKTIQWQPQQYSLRKCWRWHCCLIGFAAALSSTKHVNTSAHPDTASVFGMSKKIKQGKQSSLPFPIIILWSTGLCCSYFFKKRIQSTVGHPDFKGKKQPSGCASARDCIINKLLGNPLYNT